MDTVLFVPQVPRDCSPPAEEPTPKPEPERTEKSDVLLKLNPTLKRKHWLIVAGVALILVWVFWPREETIRQENRRLRRGAEALMRAKVEEVVGWRRTLHASIDFAGDAPATWVGHANVEIINERGGVEARKVKVSFWKDSDSNNNFKARLWCYAYLEKP